MRYFYTDPLAAAWMAKYFGMRFASHVCIEYECWECSDSPDHEYSNAGPYYIHPDSLHLLDVKRGDLCEKGDKPNSCHYCGMDRFFDADGLTIGLYGKDCRIIQRNGIPFMWPDHD